MPTLAQHVAQGRQNEALSQLIQATNPDWAVTTLFYAALHYVMAFSLAHPPMRPYYGNLKSHDATIKTLTKMAPRIGKQYRRLFDASLAARYDCQIFTQQDVNDFRDQDLAAVKAYVRKYLPLTPP